MIELCKPKDCTGCAACVNACVKHFIEMKPDKEGFLHPHIDTEQCLECGACVKVCPVLNKVSKNPLPKVFAAFNNDTQVRSRSSSGGIFYALADRVIANGGYVVGASFRKGFVLEHTIASTIEEVLPMMGSKYVQSHISNDLYKEILKLLRQRKEVLFTGTPCQVAACKNFIPLKYRDLLILVDIVCHGVPSQFLFRDYLNKLNVKLKTNIRRFNFRTFDGWGVAPSIESENNSRYSLQGKENLYMTLFLNGYTFRESCYVCEYATKERVSDITIADFWGIGENMPFSHDTSKGVSLVLVNSKQGEHLIESIENIITIEERSLDEAIRVNMNLRKPSSRPCYRDNVYQYALNHGIEETYDYYFNSLYRKLRRMIGNIIRKIK